MIVKVKTIPQEGLEIKEEKPAGFINDKNDSMFFADGIRLEASVSRAENEVLANIKVKGRIKTSCYRCLDESTRDFNAEFMLDFPVTNSTEIIDMDEDIRQETIVNLPIRLLCREDCKGLCPNCGADLNKEKCKCKTSSQ